jgi:hypothetical protein
LRESPRRRRRRADILDPVAEMLARGGQEKLIEVQRPPTEIADAIGHTRRESHRARKGEPSCSRCFFHRRMLCALDLDAPCSTFRADGPDGLVPPVQPPLLPREGAAQPLMGT